MYNVEKYIGQCLGSLLSQTFQDFEVIVVDDCSTDNSVAIVESIASKFNGRLKLVKQSKNSGSAAMPRNVGIKLSHGDYITFLDSDDLFINTALETLYNIAKETKADVVHSEKCYMPIDYGDINSQTKFHIHSQKLGSFVDKITIISNDISERIKDFSNRKFWWIACNNLFRRSLIIYNEIEFVDIKCTEDMIFSFCCLCCAKTYVRIPNTFYIYRKTPNSLTHKSFKLEEHIKRYYDILREGVSFLEKFMGKIDFFIEHSEYKYMAINFFIQWNIQGESYVYLSHAPQEINKLLLKFFNDSYNNSILSTYLFTLTNIYNLQQNEQFKKIKDLEEQLKALKGKLNT